MDWTHPSAGGAETYLKEILFRLTESHDITLFCSKGESLPDEETINGVRVIRCGVRTDDVAYINQSFIAYRYCREQVSDDVLIVNGASQLYPLFQSKDRVDIYHLFGGRDSLKGGIKNKLKFGLEWLAMRLPKGRQIAVSENQKKKIEFQTPQKISRVVNGGVDYKQFAGDVEEFHKPTLLHLGRLGAQKGTDIAIEVHRQVQQQTSFDVDFHICGTGDMDDLARQHAAESETTTYHGYVSEEKKTELMQRSWIQLMPSRSEAFPLVVLEANAAGTPVISSDIPGFTDSIENGVNGFRCDSGEMVQTSIEILEDREYQQQLSRSSQKYAEQYSWERTAKAINEAVQNHISS
ncbi:glycosyltransferase family 4 protein [Haloarcula japonica]